MTNVTLSPTELKKLGTSKLIKFMERGNVIVMSNQTIAELNTMPKEDLPEYQKHAHLSGTPIHISEAARKYDLPNPTIVRWVKKKYIARLGVDKNRVLIDEADMAYCAEVYHKHQGQGKWLFNPDGTPYIPKTD